jgi:hypothetical protein
MTNIDGDRMEQSLQIAYKGLPPSPALEERIQAKAAKLQHLHHEIRGIRVLVEALNGQEQLGRVYTVRIDVTVPNGELSVSREVGGRHHDEGDVHIALRSAFEAMAHRLEHKAPHRGHESVRR